MMSLEEAVVDAIAPLNATVVSIAERAIGAHWSRAVSNSGETVCGPAKSGQITGIVPALIRSCVTYGL